MKYGFDIKGQQPLLFANKILEVFKGQEHQSMKTLGVQSKFFALAVSVCLLNLGETLNAAPGKASLVTSSGAVTGAMNGDALAAGSVLSTGSNARATLNVNGNTVSLSENTTLSIDTLESEDTGVEEVSNIQLTLSAGLISGTVNKSSSLSKFVVKIPNGQVAVDSTSGPVTFAISAGGEVRVKEGSVDVVYDRSGTVGAFRLGGNQRFDPSTGTVIPDSGQGFPQPPATPPGTTVAAGGTNPVNQPFQFFISPNLGRD